MRILGRKEKKIAALLLAVVMLLGGCGKQAELSGGEELMTMTPAPGSESTQSPSSTPSEEPTQPLSPMPSAEATQSLSPMPSVEVTQPLSPASSEEPTQIPSMIPNAEPTQIPGLTPGAEPTQIPSLTPSAEPTQFLSPTPSATPTPSPSPMPSVEPTQSPSPIPSAEPTHLPSPTASATPTPSSSPLPTAKPTQAPTPTPTATPTPVWMETGTGFDVLSDGNNYVNGYYKHWGGEIADASDVICATEFVAVTEDAYYYYTNDPRVVVTIQQYDKDKKWIVPKEEYRKLVRGTRFTLEENTAYLSVTLRSSEWGIDVKSLFECGLIVGFVSEKPDFSVGTVDLDQSICGNPDRWRRGKYSETSGQLLFGDGGLSLDSYCAIEQVRYLISLPDKNWELQVLELTENNQIICRKKLINGEIWTPDKNAGKAAVTLVSTSKDTTFRQMEEMVQKYGSEIIGYYTDDGYNKVMHALTATEFVQKMNVGWNLGNSLDCKVKTRGLDANVKQELAWFNPYVEKSLIDYVAELGFNTIRIPVTWYYNTEVDEAGNLVIGEEFLARVKQVVNYAIENDLYVILNSHHDDEIIYAGVDDTEMKQVCKDAEALWRQIANYFKDYDEHLIFESYNEVDNREWSWTFGERAAEQVNQLNQVFVDTVRSTGGNNAQRILMVPTLIDKYKEQMLKAFTVPSDTASDRLIVQVHAYSQVFSQAIENDFILMEKYSRAWGVPIVIGEFGTTTKYFEPSLRTVHAANYIARAAKHGIKCIWWDNGGDYGIINRTDYSKSNLQMVEALFSGLDGMKCELGNEIIIDRPEDYADGSVQDKEIVVNRYWGAIATDKTGEAVSIPKGSKCVLSLTAQGDTSEVWLGSVAFYDKNGEVVSITTNNVARTTTAIKALFWTCDVPEEACYIRVSMYSPFTSISRDVFDQSLLEGKLKLSISVFDLEDVKLSR